MTSSLPAEIIICLILFAIVLFVIFLIIYYFIKAKENRNIDKQPSRIKKKSDFPELSAEEHKDKSNKKEGSI